MKINKRRVDVKELYDGMVLAEPIFDLDGKTLFSEGLKLNRVRIDRIIALEAKTVFIKDNENTINTTNYRVELQENLEVKKSIEESISKRKKLILDEAREKTLAAAKEIMEEVLDTNSTKAEKIYKVVEKVIESILKDEKVLLNLSNLTSIDEYIFSHSVNVCILSIITGIFLGFNHQRLLMLGSGALIHDIGKMLVDQTLLNKPEKLNEKEILAVRKHTTFGYKILKESMKFSEEVSNIALSHHERMDGLGYPNGLNKSNISIFAKIVAVADVFDAITSDRVYCEKVSFYDGIDYVIKNSGTQFDKDIINKFVTIIGYYPLGLSVQLSTGDIGVVAKRNKSCPIIKVMIDSSGNKLTSYYEIDLQKNPTVLIIDVNTEEYKRRKKTLN